MTTSIRGGLLLAAALVWSGCSHAKTIRAVMHSDLRALDPVVSSAYITRDHGYMIYDTLVAMNSRFEIRPQMADWKVSEDRLVYTFTLRDGLTWHDGTPVMAEDCVASLRRWAAVDSMGQKLMDFTDSLEATDARTIVLKLKEPYGLVLDSLGRPSSLVPFMMPKRLADTPPGKTISEHVGSGPFRFVQPEFQPGVQAVYEKNKDYVPRSEPPSWTAGGKVVKVDRVEWITIPEAHTAANALLTGDIDFLERPPFDLLPILQSNKDLTSGILNGLGFQTIGRMNFLYPPFDNVGVRRAALMAMNQKNVLDALTGDPRLYKLCGAMFGCDTPLATDIAAKSLLEGGDIAEARKLLAASGYDDTPVVILAPTDVITIKPQPLVVAALLRQAGFRVTLQTMDWQTANSIFTSQKPPKEGGWNMFFTNWGIADIMNPIVSAPLNSRGRKGAWAGWPDDPKMEALRDDFARAGSLADRKKIAAEIQARAFDQVTYIPLGQYFAPSVWRNELSGVLDGPATPVFWNMDKTH